MIADEGSDAWRHTVYGFVRGTEHALLEPLSATGALEVEPFRLARVAHLDPGAVVTAGLYCAAPSHAGLTVYYERELRPQIGA